MPQAHIISLNSFKERSLLYKKGMEQGFQEGKEMARLEYLEQEKKTHARRSLVHMRWFWRGMACTVTCIFLSISHVIPQLNNVLTFVIGGTAVFAAMHLKKWGWHHALFFESTYSED